MTLKRPPDYVPAREASQAAWLKERMRPWPSVDGGVYVASIVPTGFAAYARIFHPAEAIGDRREVTWGEVARTYHRIPHGEMQWHTITGDGWRRDFNEPRSGDLPEKQRRVLVDVLREFTETPGDCWFAVWEGWGCLDAKKDWPGAAFFELPGRTYVLLRGPIEAAITSVVPPPFRQGPSLWWPSDLAWCVATEVDYMWTYVGGSQDCIEAVLREDRLDAWEATPDHRADVHGDRINR